MRTVSVTFHEGTVVMAKYRVAIVGLGRMASTIDDEVVDYPAVALPYSIAAACQKIDALELVAGADILPEKREAFSKRWGVHALYEDYLQMIAREKPDLVAICTKGELHAEMAVRVAEAGVPMVYLEKAMACSMEEADGVLKACQENGVYLNTGVLRRFDSRYRQARQWIEQGAIGEPRTGVHYAATNLMHGHIHSVDTLMYLMGDPKAVAVTGTLRPHSSRIQNNRLDNDPNATYHVEFENGIEAWSIPSGHWDFEIFGTKGSIKGVNNGMEWRLRNRETPLGAKRVVYTEAPYPTPPSKSATQFCLEDLVQAYEAKRPPLGDVAIAHHATEICLAVAESHRQGGVRVVLPLENRSLYVWHV